MNSASVLICGFVEYFYSARIYFSPFSKLKLASPNVVAQLAAPYLQIKKKA
jgi:hypothetical protein